MRTFITLAISALLISSVMSACTLDKCVDCDGTTCMGCGKYPAVFTTGTMAATFCGATAAAGTNCITSGKVGTSTTDDAHADITSGACYLCAAGFGVNTTAAGV